jgi:Ser/Thr protein kinase RdoA (MazF antagonist)
MQDLWLMLPGRGKESALEREFLEEGYESILPFPRAEWKSMEYLRVLRMYFYYSWVAKRFEDPVFPRVFPQMLQESTWFSFVQDLENQIFVIEQGTEEV